MVSKEQLLKKTKRIFLIEYIAIGVVAFTLGFLKMFEIIGNNPTRLLVYNIVTTVGAAYIFFDLARCIFIKAKREKTCFIDKILTLIVGLYLLVFDILCYINRDIDLTYVKYSISSVLLYAGAISLFMGIYHHFNPNAQLLEVVDEEYEELLEEEAKEKQKALEEKKEESGEN